MHLTLEHLQHLAKPDQQPLLDEAARVNAQSPAEVQGFRKRHDLDADLASAAIHIAQAREKAQAKLGPLATTLIADVEAVEQADSLAVARYKASRFATHTQQSSHVYDLCCGMGVSTLGLVEACSVEHVTAVDHDEGRTWMAGRLAGCQAVCADVAELQIPQDAMFHIDPSRRSAGRRIYDLEQYQPGPAVWQALLGQCPSGCFKLSPGIDLEQVEALVDGPLQVFAEDGCELEFISEGGRLVQSVLWLGKLAGDTTRRATYVDVDGQTLSIAGEPDLNDELAMASASFHAVDEPVGKYLLAVDPAVERAGLMSTLGDQVGATLLHPGLGLLVCDQLPEPHAMITVFEWLDVLTYRPKKIKRWLRERGGGHVEVKTRGGVVDPNPLQVAWSQPDGEAFVMFILRFDRRVLTLATRRV